MNQIDRSRVYRSHDRRKKSQQHEAEQKKNSYAGKWLLQKASRE